MTTEKRLFHLVHSEARRRAVAAVADAPAGWRVSIEPPKRTGDQNAALHARIGEISAHCEWAGRTWDSETWKRLLVGAWSRANKDPVVMLPALDRQGVEIVFRRTSTLSRAECADLMTFIDAWAAENMQEPQTCI